MAKIEEEVTRNEKIEQGFTKFIHTYRNLLIWIGIALIAIILVVWLTIVVVDKNKLKSQVAIDNVEQSYNNWILSEEKDTQEASSIKEELLVISKKGKSSYPGIKAEYLLGLISYEQKLYDDALDYFLSASERGRKSYFGSLALFNAAVTKETLNDMQGALELYQTVYDRYTFNAAESPKALFSVARIHESNGDIELAKAILQQLADEFSHSEYAKLAEARLVLFP